jgi:hypothetical protein
MLFTPLLLIPMLLDRQQQQWQQQQSLIPHCHARLLEVTLSKWLRALLYSPCSSSTTTRQWLRLAAAAAAAGLLDTGAAWPLQLLAAYHHLPAAGNEDTKPVQCLQAWTRTAAVELCPR